jgi:hypothetical protein
MVCLGLKLRVRQCEANLAIASSIVAVSTYNAAGGAVWVGESCLNGTSSIRGVTVCSGVTVAPEGCITSCEWCVFLSLLMVIWEKYTVDVQKGGSTIFG